MPAGLVSLRVVPTGAGIWRLMQIAGSTAVTPDNARFIADPLPAAVHIVSACLFCILGAFQVPLASSQVSPALRHAPRRAPSSASCGFCAVTSLVTVRGCCARQRDIGISAGTQFFTHLPWLLFGDGSSTSSGTCAAQRVRWPWRPASIP